MDAQAVDEVERLALFGSTAFAGRRRARVGGLSAGKYSGIGGPVVRDAILRQRPTGCLDFMTSLDQQIDQALCPGLPQLLEHVGQLAQVVGVPPASYLANFRITLAKDALLQGTGLDRIAQQVGYGSAAALSRAFSGVCGQSPRSWKQSALPN